MITGQQAAIQAELSVTSNPPILYSDEDCQRFIKNTIKRAGGDIPEYAGSNDMYRNACSEILPLAIARLQPGMVLFIVEHDGNEPAQYKADGKGNASHIGWYTGGMYRVVHSSYTKGKVAASTLSNGWTHAGYLKALQYGSNTTNPAVSDPPQNAQGYINLPTTANVFHRIKPSKSSPWWGRIWGGEPIEIVSESNGWTRVVYGSHDGYVASEYVTGSAPDDTPAEPITPPVSVWTAEQVESLTKRVASLKTQIDALGASVSEIMTMMRG